ncbi:unnamed protein product [Rhizoctonia solani]|uniref:Uncharacterized protein n=1 Tax=Rhizoctonia solani TaxID=456999 RepID=A0A8H2X001_9AGAM|nr:unnamed protein product [Rhizoctonia solani]
MSKAAASLAAVSDYCDENYSFETGHSEHHNDWIHSPDWTQSSYNLPLVVTDPGDTSMYALDEGYKLTRLDEVAPLEATLELPQQDRSSGSKPFVNVAASEPTSLPKSQPTSIPESIVQTLPIPSSSQCTSDTTRSVTKPTPPTNPIGPKDDPPPKNNIATAPKPGTKASLPGAPASAQASVPVTNAAPASAKKGSESAGSNAPSRQPTDTNVKPNPSSTAPGKTGGLPSPTRIILERGFDSLPALCHVAKRCAKTVCLYNHSGLTAVISVGVMLKANTKLPVMVPASTKQDKLAAAANKFNASQSGILLWPGCITLLKIAGLADSSDIQLIQLGQPIQTSDVTKCPMTTVILSRSDLTQSQTSQSKNYSEDPLSDICNQQGPASQLQPFRAWLRSRLSDNSYARGFYWDWYLHKRRRNPKQSVIDTLMLANQYAEEFLLRGERNLYGELVGGRITVTEGTVKNQKLEGVVQMGVLLVA